MEGRWGLDPLTQVEAVPAPARRGAGSSRVRAGTAVRAGPAVRAALVSPFVARIMSVGRSGVLVRLGDGRVFALVPARTPLHAWAIAAPVVGGQLRAAAGDAVEGTGSRLDVAGVSIDLAGADVPSLRLRHRPDAARLAAAVERFAAESPPPAPEGAIADRVAALRERLDPDLVAGLVGLGPGLTPSGDDVIVGLLAGLEFAAASAEACARRRSVVGVVSAQGRLENRTTRLSAQLLSAAVDGIYPEPVLRVLGALAGPEVSAAEPRSRTGGTLRDARNALLSVGHESGRSILAGIDLGLGGLRIVAAT